LYNYTGEKKKIIGENNIKGCENEPKSNHFGTWVKTQKLQQKDDQRKSSNSFNTFEKRSFDMNISRKEQVVRLSFE